ncbi:MAG: glycosyltransferase family 39 protein [Elusimicrobia bacterium]|nr:glycosyltransferase family 39 protein [Elusimicrobiota bacterium]
MRKAREWIRREPAAAGLLLLGAVLRLLWLSRPSLSSDEAFTLIIAREPAAAIPSLVHSLETTPALHFLLMRFWLPLWTDPLIGLRLFSALCASAALPLYWSVCRRLAPGQERLAFFLGATSSLWIHCAQMGRCYALVLLVSTAQLVLALRLMERWSLRDAWLYAALALCGLYTHYFYGFFLLGLACNLLLERRLRERALLPLLALHAAVALAFLPGVSGALAQRRMALGIWFVNEPFSARGLARVLGAFLFDPAYLGLALPGTAAAVGLGSCVLAAAALWRLGGRLTARPRFCLVNIAVPVAAAAAVGWVNGKPAFQARYLVFLGLSLYPLLAAAAERGLPSLWGRGARIGLAFASCLGSLTYFSSNLIFDPRLDALSAFVRRAADPEEPIVHWGALEYAALRSYYLPERRHYLVDLDPGDSRYARLPGPEGLIEPDRLAGMGKVLVFDPQRRAFPRRIGETSGPELLRLIRARR